MRRWSLETCSAWLRGRSVWHISRTKHPLLGWQSAKYSSADTSSPGFQQTISNNDSSAPSIFSRVEQPTKKAAISPDEWIALLEPALPPHLQSAPLHHHGVQLNGKDVSEILLAAQALRSKSIGFDLLHYLGFEKQRWRAVVYLVKLMIDTFDAKHHDVLSPSMWQWDTSRSLEVVTGWPIPHQFIVQPVALSTQSQSTSLDRMTSDAFSNGYERRGDLRRDALGQVWRSLGNMIISCVDEGGIVYPEILEMIAYLHHHGWMPDGIYKYTPNSDPAIIQQSPILNMCSSRILTSLSDAAWWGHEKSLVETVQEAGDGTVHSRPELAGSSYRVNVAGLKPEVWLELILWASLYGGWIAEGIHIMRLMIVERKGWTPLSWRALMSTEQARSIEWHDLGHIFNTQPPQRSLSIGQDVGRTVSSEVVNAYVDALITSFGMSDKQDKASIDRTVEQLQVLRRFLDRSSLLLGIGSWDAAIIRLLDFAGDDVMQSSHLSSKLLSLSANFGGGLQSSDAKILPSYVLDGSAAVLGLYHQAFHKQIVFGNLHGALMVLWGLQSYTDANKRKSVNAFFSNIATKTPPSQSASNDMFTSPYSGIDFPAYDPHIPSSTLAAFLDLITDYKAFDLGRWLLYSDAIDGPLVPEERYHDPTLSPAIIRFAVASKDEELLVTSVDRRKSGKASRASMSRSVLHSYMDTQITLRRWNAVVSLLNYMKSVIKVEWTLSNFASLARVMLFIHRDCDPQSRINHADLTQAKRIFTDMATGKYDIGKQRHHQSGPRLLLAILSHVDPYWAEFCLNLSSVNLVSHIQFPADTQFFNTILETAVSCYGSTTGRSLLDIFWSESIRAALRRRQSGERVNILETVQRQRTEVKFNHPSNRTIAVLGGLVPNIRTIVIVMTQAIQELQDLDALKNDPLSPENELSPTPRQTVVWAIRVLLELGMREVEIRQELSSRLSVEQLQDLEHEYRAIVQEHRALHADDSVSTWVESGSEVVDADEEQGKQE